MNKLDTHKRLTLNSPYFDEAREELDRSLQDTVSAMVDKNIGIGSVTLKLSFELTRGTIPDENAPTGVREALPMGIKYRVSRQLQASSESKGDIADDLMHEVIQGDDRSWYLVNRDEASAGLNEYNSFDELPDEEDEG